MKIHDPGNYQVIKRLYAVVTVDQDGNECLVAFQSEGRWNPMMTGDYALAQKFLKNAEELTLPAGKTVKLLRFDRTNK